MLQMMPCHVYPKACLDLLANTVAADLVQVVFEYPCANKLSFGVSQFMYVVDTFYSYRFAHGHLLVELNYSKNGN